MLYDQPARDLKRFAVALIIAINYQQASKERKNHGKLSRCIGLYALPLHL